MIYLACLLLAVQLWQWITLFRGQRQTHALPEQPAVLISWPKVSIVIPARNEAADIERALSSVLHLDYPNREIIVVNDRSTDNTATILHRLQAQHSDLRVLTIKHLPTGWLGKNYALFTGATTATGDLLLFTDADVVFSTMALKKAVGVLETKLLDHLTLGPKVCSPSWIVNLLVALFGRSFSLFLQPWRARDPHSSRFIGLGAFNLIRRTAYTHIGGHQRISLRPDDDLKLGKVIKQAGFRQEYQQALEDLRLAWYPSLSAFVHGLEKNVLAGMDYRVSALFLALALQLTLGLLPWVLLLVNDPLVRGLALATVLASLTSFSWFLKHSETSVLLTPLEPIILLLFVFTCARSAVLTLVRGGIIWRGTFYPLPVLRQNVI